MTLHEIAHFYTSFKGRATRADFNLRYVLVLLLGSIVAAAVDYIMVGGDIMALVNGGFASTLFNLLVIVPTFALVARRLQDMNVSGWWQLLAHGVVALAVAIPLALYGPLLNGISMIMALSVVAVIALYLVFWIALSCIRGTHGPNKFGDDPLEGWKENKNDGK